MKGRQLLLIDDDTVSLEVLRLVLSASGFAVTPASGPAEALQLLAAPALIFDVILSDVQMPGVNSAEFLQTLRVRSDATLIVMSGSNPDRTMLTGADGFLLKPFEVSALKAMLDGLPRRTGNSISKAVFDRTMLLKAMPEHSARQVYEAYLEDAPKRLRRMEQSLGADLALVAREAHILRGSAAMIGAGELAGLCSRLEDSAARGVDDHGDLATMMAAIHEAAARLEGILKEELGR